MSAPELPPYLEPGDREQWRAWLAQHHSESKGTWLAIGKKGNRVTRLDYGSAVEEALCFGWIDSTVRRLDDDRFIQLFTPRKRGSGWAKSNKERAARLIAEGRMTAAGLAVIEAAQADGSWDHYDRLESLEVPDDLAAAFAAAPGTAERFEHFTESQRRTFIYRIMEAKRPETRAKRIAETLAAAEKGVVPWQPRRE